MNKLKKYIICEKGIGLEELDSRISEDMLLFIYKKENTEEIMVFNIDDYIINKKSIKLIN